jgi:hypothetical protein
MPAATIFPDSGECAYSIEKKDEEDAIYSFLGEHFLQQSLTQTTIIIERFQKS